MLKKVLRLAKWNYSFGVFSGRNNSYSAIDFSSQLEGEWFDENLQLQGKFLLDTPAPDITHPWRWSSTWECSCGGKTNNFEGTSIVLSERILTTLNPDPEEHEVSGIVAYSMEHNTLFANWTEFGMLELNDCPGIGVALCDHPNEFVGDWNMNYLFSIDGEPGLMKNHIKVDTQGDGKYFLEWRDQKTDEEALLKGFGMEVEENKFGISWGLSNKFDELKFLNLDLSELHEGVLNGTIMASSPTSEKCSKGSTKVKLIKR